MSVRLPDVPILISAHQVSKTFTSRPLFEGVSFSISSGERIGLIGPNGAGKSTMLKILAGLMPSDSGTLSIQRGLRVGYLEQVPIFSPGATVLSSVMEGATDPYDWEEMARAEEIMSKLSLTEGSISPESEIASLSGGWKKRVALARELLKQPDLILLDEPTNHLDIESILWLEELLAKSQFATLTITHDRLFLQRIANRILELDRRHPGGLISVNGDYATFLEVRENQLAAQEQQEVKLRNTLRRETEWLRRGAKARQTKQQARIQKAGDLKDTVDELNERNQISTVRLDFQSAERNPKKLIEAKGISKKYSGTTVVPLADLLITPKTRLGLIGPNGCGKSTLIRLLTGSETPDTGTIFQSEQLKVTYFEQNRESLDPEANLFKTISPSGAEYVDFRGSRIHVKGYLARFLFSHEQMSLPVSRLSGGEQSRLLIAKLMLKETNVLILDEPTNDLDMSTLDVLEEVLQDFAGAVILVTHDRYFLDRVTRQILAFGFDPKGQKIMVPMSGLSQWEVWHEDQMQNQRALKVAGEKAASGAKVSAEKKRKLTYNEQREFDNMEATIHRAEAELAALTAESLKPENATKASKLAELTTQMTKLQTEIDRLYARWTELS